MATKTTAETPSNKLIIRSVFKITKCYMEPAKNPTTGRWPDCVRDVDSKGDLLLSDDDRRSNRFFVKSSDVIEIYDGKEFDLNDEVSSAQWESIKFSKRIAQDRAEKDALGNLVIDGNARKYGTAEFYIERPGYEAQQKNNKRREIHRATGYIHDDSPEGLYQKVRVLGNPMNGLPQSDVEDYLVTIAERNPNTIIDLYTGTDTQLRIFLLDAQDKSVIVKKNGLFYYGDTLLGSTDVTVVNWFKNPSNKTTVELIKGEVYPDFITKKK